MDCKDLMVKDLVYVVRGYDKHLTIEKIKGVIADENEPYPVTIFTGETVSLNDIKPIPLTEDILLKNGWRKQTMLYKNEWYGDIGLFEEHGEFYYMDLNIEYVHQLQHLLQLCGIEKEIEL